MQNFSEFVLTRILQINKGTNSAFIEAKEKSSDQKALILMNKTPFTEEQVKGILEDTPLSCTMQNGKYSVYNGFPLKEVNPLQISITCPATDEDIAKYSQQDYFIFRETPTIYHNITKKFIDSIDPNSVKWINDILEKKAETERVIFENDNFILLQNMRWDGKDVTDLYCLALVKQKDLKSIRDLRGIHIPLLEEIDKKGKEAIQKKYNIPKNMIRVFFHYLPTFYHLHVHFMATCAYYPGTINIGKAIFIEDVIDNLKMNDDYYNKANISYIIGNNHPLFTLLKIENVL